MSIHERCWKCDSFDLQTNICQKAAKRSLEKQSAITCNFSWGTPDRPNAHLTVDFHQEIHPENIREIAMVMAQTAANKLNCLNLCACQLEADNAGISGNA